MFELDLTWIVGIIAALFFAAFYFGFAPWVT